MSDRADLRVLVRAPTRRELRPAQPEHAHLDLLPEVLELLRLRPALQIPVDRDIIDSVTMKKAKKPADHLKFFV